MKEGFFPNFSRGMELAVKSTGGIDEASK